MDRQNQVYNIEIQRDDKGAGVKRARYNSKISRDKADKLIYEYLNNYIMYELYYSYRSTLEKCEFQELYQSLWVEVLADLPRFNPDLGRATTFFRYSIKHAVCIFVSFKIRNSFYC